MDASPAEGEPDLLDSLRPLMERYGVRCTPKEFYEAVNLHFHAAESSVYDAIHREMWQTLPVQFMLLTDDCLPISQKALRVLDVGSGTGLSAELFLKTALGARTTEIHLLDTSKEMLNLAATRGRDWKVTVKTHCCPLSELSFSEKFDVVIACSVLHHIPDLTTFLREVALHQGPDGFFLHFQDQNADYADDKEYRLRMAECREAHVKQRQRPFIQKLTPRRIYRRIVWAVNKRRDYIAKTNRSLIDSGIVDKKMDALDIWRVTDIRITPAVNGISLRKLQSLLPSYDLVSARSYAFFGEGGDNLPVQFRALEMNLIEQRAMNGHLVAGVWKRRSNQFESHKTKL